ncbi:unnamed protein product [Toxocara canis]|uniref:Secreted protein n=1 Tax=Toxocara canis TaxID=6265 RepID=A0A183VE09_TOXCA|nr:unnamed protein product [Toxocara canis]
MVRMPILPCLGLNSTKVLSVGALGQGESWETKQVAVRLASECLKSVVTKLFNNGPQFPACQMLRSTALTGRKVFGERPLKISGATAGAPCGLRLSLCTYNCRSLS